MKGDRMRILLVDDEEELVSTLAERLFFRNIKADWVTSPDDALELAKNNRYDLALLDVKMPKINGFELKKKLTEQHPNMKFIFLTGHGLDKDYPIDISEAEVFNYLAKPCNIDNLIKTITNVLSSNKG